MNLIEKWAARGLSFTLLEDDRIRPSRKVSADEMAELRRVVRTIEITERDEVAEELRRLWLDNIIKQAKAELSDYCDTEGHETATVYQYSPEGRAMCADCASAASTTQQAVLPSLDTTDAAEATTRAPSASGAERYYA